MLKRAVVALFLIAVASGPLFGQGSRITPATATFQKDAIREDAPGLIKPIAVQSVWPQYTPEAMRLKVQGAADVQIVVDTDGSVARTRVVQVTWSGDSDASKPFTDATPGLVANALTAAKAWKFRPGTLDGAPVPVLTTITLTFRLH